MIRYTTTVHYINTTATINNGRKKNNNNTCFKYVFTAAPPLPSITIEIITPSIIVRKEECSYSSVVAV